MSRKSIDTLDPHIAHVLFQNWFAAAESDNAALMASFMREYDMPLDRIGPRGTTALMEAAFAGHLGVLELLLDAGADLDVHSPAGGTALAYAAVGDRVPAVELLCRRGASLDAADVRRGVTPLGQATMRRLPETRRALLEAGASVWAGDPSAVEIAAGLAPRSVYDELRAHATFAPPPERADDRLFWFAAAGGMRDVAEELLDAGADPRYARGSGNALHQCARNGTADAIPWLVSRGLDPNEPSGTGWTPLLLATKGGHQDTAIALLRAGARPDDPEPKLAMTPLIHAAYAGHERLVRALLEHGADPSFVGEQEKRRAVDWAREAGHETVVALLEAT